MFAAVSTVAPIGKTFWGRFRIGRTEVNVLCGNSVFLKHVDLQRLMIDQKTAVFLRKDDIA